jgi:spoIIIJ-associated protein
MTRRSHVQAENFTEALRSAIADLTECEYEKVELSLQAPGLDGLRGKLQIDLEVLAPAATPDTPEPPAAANKRSANSSADVDDEITPEQLDEEADAAADFLEGLLDALDLPGDLRIRVKEQHAEVEIADVGSGALIGRRGQTLEAMQELVRCAMQRRFERRSRVQIDVEGYRARRLEKLVEKAEEAIDAALDTGEPQRLEPMDVFERKAVHQLVAEVDGLASRSQGREPGRRIVIEPDD